MFSVRYRSSVITVRIPSRYASSDPRSLAIITRRLPALTMHLPLVWYRSRPYHDARAQIYLPKSIAVEGENPTIVSPTSRVPGVTRAHESLPLFVVARCTHLGIRGISLVIVVPCSPYGLGAVEPSSPGAQEPSEPSCCALASGQCTGDHHCRSHHLLGRYQHVPRNSSFLLQRPVTLREWCQDKFGVMGMQTKLAWVRLLCQLRQN